MSTVDLALPVEIPGEDIENPPYQPVSAASVRADQWPASSAEFGAPLKHEGWVPAVPTWDDLTAAERADHRQVCAEGCALCGDARSWGLCSSCGSGNAEAGEDGTSQCCGERVLFGQEADRAWTS